MDGQDLVGRGGLDILPGGGAKRWQETGGLIEAFLLTPLDPRAWGKVYKP